MKRPVAIGILIFFAGAFFCPIRATASPITKARKLLALLRLVDGAGSGLDADTVSGMRPQDIGAATVSTLMTDLLHYVNTSAALGAGECNCVWAECNDGDFAISCGGRIEPYSGGGVLSSVTTVVVTGTTQQACEACGCNNSGTALTARAFAQCIGMPDHASASVTRDSAAEPPRSQQ